MVTQEALPREVLSLRHIQQHRDELMAIAKRHGVISVRIFGSVARGEATAMSDLDLIVEVQPGVGLLTLSAFALDVETLFGTPTQVVTPDGLRSHMRQEVLREAVAV